MLAIAVIASNQDRNLGAVAGYSEAGGCRIIGRKVADELDRCGVEVLYVEPALESADTTEHEALYRSFGNAKRWLDGYPGHGYRTAAVHIHTNAASKPEEGTSHTGFCWSMNEPESRNLGRPIAKRVAAVLGLPVVEYRYTNWLYDKLLLPHPSTIIEVTRHDRKPDLEALYARVDAVAVAIAEGIVAWGGVGGEAASDELTRLRRENERLRAIIAEALRRAGDLTAMLSG